MLGGLQIFATDFTALNNSGVDGQALVLLDSASHTLTVHIAAEGLEPGQMHAQHIHGFSDGTDAVSPTLAQDADYDGFVELGEGVNTYGPIQLNLTQHAGDASFPMADENGMLSYTETFHFDGSDAAGQMMLDGLMPLDAKEIVLHGLT
ncbi:hypothetical protein E0493_22905, partial [Roseomonas sp. M0104]|nr:hypothetical protein [Pseudoroseomonas coralli]